MTTGASQFYEYKPDKVPFNRPGLNKEMADDEDKAFINSVYSKRR